MSTVTKIFLEIDNPCDVNTDEVKHFKWDFGEYTKDHHVKTFMEKLFGVELKACYTSSHRPLHPEGDYLAWDNAQILVFHMNGTVVGMHNSEWANIQLITKGNDDASLITRSI